MFCDRLKRIRIFQARAIGLLVLALLSFGLYEQAHAAIITVAKAGTGTGVVTSSPAGINCGPLCSHSFNDQVTLTATADTGSTFVSWTGCDNTTDNQCVLSGGLQKTVTVTFAGPNDKTIRIGSVNSSCSFVYACVEVKGASGFLNNLTQRDFTVFEDSVQKTDFTLQTATCPGASTAVAMTMDYSGSMPQTALTDMETAAVDFITRITATGSEAEIVKFSDTVEVVQPFTSNLSALTSAVLDPWSGAGGSTALFDSAYQALVDTVARNANTRAVVAMTDGGDNASTHTLDDVIQLAKDNQIPIFTVGLGAADATALTQMAVDTGGKYFEAPTSAELAGIYSAIASDLDVIGYLLTYAETDLRPGRPHTLKIKVADNTAGSKSVQYSTLGCYTLTVNASGNAGGSVFSNIGGIDFSYPATGIMSTILTSGSHVNLFADLAAANSEFAWSGACSGGATPCQIDMDADNKNVSVAFASTFFPSQRILSITKAGSGAGTIIPVTEQGDGSNQLSNWSLTWLPQTEVKAYTFYWSLLLEGGARTVKLYRSNSKSTVDLVASGSLIGDGTIILSDRSGSGLSGRVDVVYTGDDVDSGNAIMGSLLWNGNTATSTHNNGDVVTLTPVTNSGSFFAGWGGDCSGLGPCEVTMNASRNVTANFETAAGNYALSVTKSGSGSGNVIVNGVTFANTIPQQFENGDTANQLSNWNLTGISASNTDDYILYWDLTDSGGTRTVRLYKSAAKAAGDLVAQGSLAGNGTLIVIQQNSSGLSGSVDVAYNSNDTDINNTLYFAVITENGDETSMQLSNWDLTGISGSNTDVYTLYWNLTDLLGKRTVSLYKSAAKAPGDLVAEGFRLGDGIIILDAKNGSGLSGHVTVALRVALDEAGDATNQLANWLLSGLSTTNIDPTNKSLYWDLTDFDRLGTVNLYRAATKTSVDWVASGSRTGNGQIILSERNFSGMSGSLDATFQPVITEVGDDLDPGQVSNWLLQGTAGLPPEANTLYWKLTDVAGTRHISLSQFVEGGDTFGQVGNWQLQGMNPGNMNGNILYWNLTVSGIDSCSVDLYESPAKGALDRVASGAGTCGAVLTLTEDNLSGLFGTVEVNGFATDTNAGNTLTLTEIASGNGVGPASLPGDGTINISGSGLTGSVDVRYQLNDNNVGDSVYPGNMLLLSFQDTDAENVLRISYNDTDSGNSLVLPLAGDFIWTGNRGTATFKINDIATLAPVAAAGSTFTGWTGCDSVTVDNLCVVTMNANRSITANFTRPPTALLTINISGTGGGSVSASSGTITWNGAGTIGTGPYNYSTPVTLTATPAAGAVFTGWSGACRNTGNTCLILMGSDQSVTAHFLLSNTSSFADVPSGSYSAPYIETLFNNSISTACSGSSYCPNDFISNAEVAVFIIKALELQPSPTCTGNIYGDVNAAMTQGSEVCRYIEAFSELNIMARRGDGFFLPSAFISRGEMAVVLLNALGVLPADICSTIKYDDVNGSIFGGSNTCRYIEKLWEFSTAVGCSANNFCPDNPVLRADMSIFLSETFLQPNNTCRTKPVRNNRTFIAYDSIQTAYSDLVNPLVNGDILQITGTASAQAYTNTVDFNLPVSITLRGGYDCGFISSLSSSSIQGVLTITAGDVTIDRVEIQ